MVRILKLYNWSQWNYISISVMKEIGYKWLVDAADHISNNPQLIVNEFLHAGITSVLDGNIISVPNCDDDTTSKESDDDDDDDDDDDEEDNAITDYSTIITRPVMFTCS